MGSVPVRGEEFARLQKVVPARWGTQVFGFLVEVAVESPKVRELTRMLLHQKNIYQRMVIPLGDRTSYDLLLKYFPGHPAVHVGSALIQAYLNKSWVRRAVGRKISATLEGDRC